MDLSDITALSECLSSYLSLEAALPPPPTTFYPSASFTNPELLETIYRARLLGIIFDSNWFKHSLPEPVKGKAGELDDLIIADPGHSIWVVYLKQVQGERKWLCRFAGCQHSVINPFERIGRGIDHIRAHVNHRPFACEKECANQNCTRRFTSDGLRKKHIMTAKRSAMNSKQCED